MDFSWIYRWFPKSPSTRFFFGSVSFSSETECRSAESIATGRLAGVDFREFVNEPRVILVGVWGGSVWVLNILGVRGESVAGKTLILPSCCIGREVSMAMSDFREDPVSVWLGRVSPRHTMNQTCFCPSPKNIDWDAATVQYPIVLSSKRRCRYYSVSWHDTFGVFGKAAWGLPDRTRSNSHCLRMLKYGKNRPCLYR